MPVSKNQPVVDFVQGERVIYEPEYARRGVPIEPVEAEFIRVDPRGCLQLKFFGQCGKTYTKGVVPKFVRRK